jgi:pimeloyl-ACP methyl ester carboxylesterase
MKGSWIALACAVVATLGCGSLFFCTRFFHGKPGARVVRRHLYAFAWAWLLLSAYYWVAFVLQALGQAYLLDWPPRPTEFGWALFIYHGWALVICAITNTYLQKSISWIEPDVDRVKVGTAGAPTRVAKRILSNRLLLLFSDQGVPISAVVSLLLLILAHVRHSNGPIIAGYAVQLVVSSVLFFRMGVVQAVLGRSAWLTVAPMTYALPQLAFPFHHLSPWPEAFPIVLHCLKPILLISTIVAAFRMMSLLQESQPFEDYLKQLGGRLERTTEVNGNARAVVLLLTGAALVGVSIGLYSHSRVTLGLPFAHWHLALWLIATILSLQGAAYLARMRFRARFDWLRIGDGELAEQFASRERQRYPSAFWSSVEIRAKREQPAGVNGNLRVVLLHGLFGSGSSSWGLLPLLLARQPDVKVVEVLTYKHSLWWLRDRLFTGLCNQFRFILHAVLAGEGEDAGEEVAVFGHSMGGLLALSALVDLQINPETRARLARLRCLALVGSPLRGTVAALLTFPWIWSRRLLPGRPFLRKLIISYTSAYPPAGHIVGEEQIRPMVTVLKGIDDPIAGASEEFAGLPAVAVQDAAGTHSDINFIVAPDSPAVSQYVQVYRATDRSVFLMRLLASTLSGRRRVRASAIFQRRDGLELGAQPLVDVQLTSWGEGLSSTVSGPTTGKTIKDWLAHLATRFGVASREIQERLEADFLDERLDGRLVTVPFGTDRHKLELWAFSNRFAGFLVLVEA